MAIWEVKVEMILEHRVNMVSVEKVEANQATTDKTVAFRALCSFIQNNLVKIAENSEKSVERLISTGKTASRQTTSFEEFKRKLLTSTKISIGEPTRIK